MKKTILLVGLTMASLSMFAQGFLDFSYTAGSGISVGSAHAASGGPAGAFAQGDYSVQAFGAAGTNQPESSLQPLANAKTTFLGGATTTASGSPATDGSGLWFAGSQDTGLPTGGATVEVKVWYDPNHNTTFDQAVLAGVNTGKSALLTFNLVGSTDPTIQSLDTVGMAAFTVGTVPEPSTFALAGLGAAAMLIFRRRK